MTRILSILIVSGWLFSHELPKASGADTKSAEDCKDPNASQILKCFSVDLAMPDSPGLQIVGLGSSDALRPTSPRTLGLAISNGVDRDGRAKSGAAVSFAPYKILKPETTRDVYENSRFMRALWNTEISFGVGKALDSEDKSFKVGYGLSSVVWRRDGSDPVMNTEYQNCLEKRIQEILSDPTPPAALGSETKKDEGLAKCYATLTQKMWNATGLTIGVAGSQTSESGKWGDSTSGSSGVWVTLSYGFDDFPASFLRESGEVLITWRRLGDERVADTDAPQGFYGRTSNALSAVFRIRNDVRNWYLEVSRQRLTSEFKGEETSRRLVLGMEWKLADGMWITAALGGEGGRADGENHAFVLTGLKFGTTDKPIFAQP